MTLPPTAIKHLQLKANEIREDILKMLVEAGSGHTAGPLGMADIFTALYFHILHHNPHNPSLEERDRLILSNGHICPVLYTTLAHANYFPISELKTLRKLGTKLQGHPHRESLPGLETTSGPLGSGLSQGSGMAYAARMDGKKHRVIVLMSDGEQEAGNTWEAAMFAGKNKLDNLVAVIDRNNIQIDGFTEDIMPLEPLADKYRAFNWHVIEIDGHNFQQIHDAFDMAKTIHGMPTLILAHTTPGKGVDFMENKFEWHGKPPKPEEADEALKQLKEIERSIR
jgi:transketolase